MKSSGFLKGMTHTYENPVIYHLPLEEDSINLNDWIGKEIILSFQGDIQCTNCGRKIKKSFQNGYCFPCVTSLAETDLCIVKPHECHFHLGTCRDEKFAETYCMIPHIVYLAVSSGIKVGITRKNNHMKRWVDQGAIQGIPIAEVPNRKTAGELEMAIAEHLPDKTDWRKMLKGEAEIVDLLALRQEVFGYFPKDFRAYFLSEENWVEIVYPIMEALQKIKSYNLDKEPTIQDRLIGIKGQYLIFEKAVLNIKKFTGYKISISA